MQGLGESSRSSDEFGETIYSQIAPVNMSASVNSTPSPYPSPSEHTSYSVTKKKRKSLGTLTRMFGKSRQRRSIAVTDPSILEGETYVLL